MTSGWRSVLGIGAVTIAILLGLAACLDADMDILVNEDGSGSMDVSMDLDAYLRLMEELAPDEDAKSLCEEALHDLEAETLDLGSEILNRLDWSYDGKFEEGPEACELTYSASWNAAESEAVLLEFVWTFGSSIYRLASGGWRFEMDLSELYDISDGLTSAAMNDTQPSEDLTGAQLFSELAFFLALSDFSLTVSVTLPGEVVGHNANSVSQARHTWEIDFSNTATADTPEARMLYLQTKPSGGDTTASGALGVEPSSGSDGLGAGAIVAIVAGALLVLVAFVGLYWRQRAKASAAIQGSPLTHGTTANPATKTDEDSGATGDATTDSDEAREDANLHEAEDHQTEQQQP